MATDRDIIGGLHAGGVQYVLAIPTAEKMTAIDRLTTCHDHVFVIDQSHGLEADYFSIGVSKTGLACLREIFPEIPARED